MISRLRLRFGRVPGSPGEWLDVTPVTVFVGPNNSGKSKVLSEIHEYCVHGQVVAGTVILEQMTFADSDHDAAVLMINKITRDAIAGEPIAADHIVVGGGGSRIQVPYQPLIHRVERPSENCIQFCNWFLRWSTLRLDGQSRIALTGQQHGGDLQQPPITSLQVLFRDNAKRLEVRRIVHDAFGVYFVIDATLLGQLRIRLSQREPDNEMEERGLHDAAVRFHAAAQAIDSASDGVKAFTGILTELLAGDPQIVTIDEPEAFLHPSLAAKLGLELAKAAGQTNKRVFISTHSPAFVMGCIQSGVPVNIVRLTYRAGVATARVLPSDEILSLMRHPLLRSTGVLSGLFYEFVVVTESDTDRAFYQEVNERLLAAQPNRGIPNCLFINAQNKQTERTILQPLRKLGIPTAAILDIDVLRDGGAEWTGLLSSASIPQISHEGLANIRAALNRAFVATGRNMKTDGGIAILPADSQEAAQNLLAQLADYGVFVVPGGELESWLKNLGVTGHGPTWLIGMFERMGSDPSAEGYVKPSEDDVWLFLSRVRAWLSDPARSGIPA